LCEIKLTVFCQPISGQVRDFALNVLSLEGERNVAVGLRTTNRAWRCWDIWKTVG